MTNWMQYGLFLIVVTALVPPFGAYMARVFKRETTPFDRLLRPLEKFTHQLLGIDEQQQMNWKQYAWAFVALTFAALAFLFLVLRVQAFLPWFYADSMNTPMTNDLAWNVAVSFTTTSTWQPYGGETTMSYLSQVLALVMGSFLAGAAGLAVGVVFIRGFVNERDEKIGNFYVDYFRSLYWILLPLALLGSLLLVAQGVPMNFNPYTHLQTLEGPPQVLAQGPVAALEFIKNLGTNGGGFFNVNGAHPYANPTPWTNFLGMLGIVVLPAAFTYTFGILTRKPREGWALYITMVILFCAGLFFCDRFESAGNPCLSPLNLSTTDNMEGKEVRFGTAQTVLTAIVTSNTSTGSTNSMHDSFTPLGSMIPFVNMLLGQFVFGGLGGGLYSMIFWVILTMFVVGLTVGRTPEYLGVKIGPTEMKLVAVYALTTPLVVLILGAISVMTTAGLAGLSNQGPHGLTTILYAYASCNANNGQAFAGLNANTVFYNTTTSIAMLLGRLIPALVALAIAGRFALQPRRAPTPGTMPSDTPTFVAVLIGTISIMGGLSYMPVLLLGSYSEHCLMQLGKLF